MSKPKKITNGHSYGPQAYWDSISDAKQTTKTTTGTVMGDLKKLTEIERLEAENERLRGLLRECQPYIWNDGPVCDDRLVDAIENELEPFATMDGRPVVFENPHGWTRSDMHEWMRISIDTMNVALNIRYMGLAAAMKKGPFNVTE